MGLRFNGPLLLFAPLMLDSKRSSNLTATREFTAQHILYTLPQERVGPFVFSLVMKPHFLVSSSCLLECGMYTDTTTGKSWHHSPTTRSPYYTSNGSTVYNMVKPTNSPTSDVDFLIDRPGVAGAVLQTASLLIKSAFSSRSS